MDARIAIQAEKFDKFIFNPRFFQVSKQSKKMEKMLFWIP
jgi:hypothetical protein